MAQRCGVTERDGGSPRRHAIGACGPPRWSSGGGPLASTRVALAARSGVWFRARHQLRMAARR